MGYGGRGGWRRGVAAAAGAALCLSAGWAQAADRYAAPAAKALALDTSLRIDNQVSIQSAIAELIKGYQVIRRNQYSNV